MIVNISYQTLVQPPPFAFAYTLELNFEASQVKIKYDLEFLNRDEISPEEIEEEGFSENDDFSWEGSLGKEWVDDLMNDLADVDLEEEEGDDYNIYLHMEIKYDDGHVESGTVVLADDWDYRLQEVIQAIYEKAGIEDKLKMTCLDINDGKQDKYILTGSFEHRSAAINDKPIAWDKLHEIIADIYTIEFDQEPVQTPKEEGLWIDPDGMSGFQCFDEQARPKGNQIKERILKELTQA